ncbi:lipopolysaccharide heptosyltransferase II [bacterium]|nr:lipopolysaccharide heptosyltransferase II [bacterium]
MKQIPDPASIQRIVVRMTNWVGDVVMNTPFLCATKSLFPNAEIIAMARPSVAPLLDPHPCISAVWPIDDRSRQGYMACVRKLRGLKPDLGFALPNSMNAAIVLRLGGVRYRVGYDRDARGFMLTHPIELRPQDLAVHEVKYYMRLLSPWGVHAGDAPPLTLHVTDQEREDMAAWLRARGVADGQPVLGVNPAAFYGTAKRWLPERFAEVAARLAKDLDARVFVTGIPRERDVAEEVVSAGGPAFYNAAGEMKLRELMAFFTRCRLYLTNDSGAMHLAAALGTPLVAVFGSTDWVTTAPLSPIARIVREETECAPCLLRHCPIDHRCMNRVTSDTVYTVANKLVQETQSTAV